MKKFLLTMGVLLSMMSAGAQEVTTSISTRYMYTLECCSGAAHSNARFISDNGTTINGQSSSSTYFAFEDAGEGKYYIKSLVSGKYLNFASPNKINAEETASTKWEAGVVTGTNAVSFKASETSDRYLNNNGSQSDGGCTNLQGNQHTGGPTATNACSTWTLREYPIVTTVNTDCIYTLECCSGAAHSNTRFISDDGTIINGQSSSSTYFAFEDAGEGKYYIKSLVSGKYLNFASPNKINAEETASTKWEAGVVTGTNAVSFKASETSDRYLNNNGSQSDGGCTNLQGNQHTGGPSATNACSTWTLKEYVVSRLLQSMINAYAGYQGGTEIGLYTAESVSGLQAAISEANSAITNDNATYDNIKNLQDAIDALQFNVPAPGKFYRLKNAASNRYMADLSTVVDDVYQVNMSDLQGAQGAESRHTTIFYLDQNNELLSFSNGLYVDCSGKCFAAVGTKYAGTFGLAYGGPTAGVVTYRNNGYWVFGNRNDNEQIDRGATTPGAAGYNWRFEEVEWLPVPMNTTVGYGTIYSPVRLECSSSRVEAYTVASVAEDNASVALAVVDYIPANTGVILKYKSGAENGNVYLKVLPNDEVTVESKLEGTFAATHVTDEAYVLSKPEDKPVGLYKAMMNQDSGAAWKNNGFKAYLPASALNAIGGEAQALAFDFGTETGIGSIESVDRSDTNNAIFDLSGRRVKKAQKGIYIISGKKLIK